ncbi:MAG: hypothetical protein QM489_07930 [Candidatus Izemoplasma sp.]
MKTRRLLAISLSVAIIFSLEQVLMFLPNVQLTTLLIFIFVSFFTFKESVLMISIYVLIDNLYLGGFNVFYMMPMFIAWNLIPVAYHTVLRKTKSEYILAFFAFGFGFVYGWIFIPFVVIQTGMNNFIPYLIADIPFEIIMAFTNFATIFWLYKPLYKKINDNNLLSYGNEIYG